MLKKEIKQMDLHQNLMGSFLTYTTSFHQGSWKSIQ